MDANQFLIETESGTAQIVRATVVAVRDDGAVELSRDGGGLVVCDVLTASDAGSLTLAARDLVVVWHSGRMEDRGVILGRIGPSLAGSATELTTPDELIVEAKHSLTLRVGDGSITIREDGKILIKGKDLVSHATRMNRIKGGSVQIN